MFVDCIYINILQFYWDLIAVQHCIILRYVAMLFDLPQYF